jgi:tetratricopeptide (TPR) repeat protein
VKIIEMIFGTHEVAARVRVGLIFLALAAAGMPLLAQPQQKPPAKAPAKSAPQAQEDPLAPLMLRAQDAIDKKDFAAALESLQKYIAQKPDDPIAHFQLGYACAELERWEEARAEFSRAIALDPKMAPAHLNLGMVLMDSEPLPAAEAFRRAAELQPGESRPRFLAGFAFEQAGKFTEAIEQYRGALAISPRDYEYHFALGRALLRADNAVDAEVQFQEAVAARGNSAPARLGLAQALLAQKKYESGTDALAEYLKLNPDDRAERFDRASSLLQIDRYDDALAELDRAEAGSAPTAEGLKMRGNIYLHQKNWKASSEALTRAISSSPQDPELLEWLGHVEIELHDYPTAIKVLSQAHANRPQSIDALRDLTAALYLHGDYAAAISAMDGLAKVEQLKPISWFIRAICYDKLSRKAEAIDAYQKFLDQDKGQDDTRDFQARRRILTLQSELRHSPQK